METDAREVQNIVRQVRGAAHATRALARDVRGRARAVFHLVRQSWANVRVTHGHVLRGDAKV